MRLLSLVATLFVMACPVQAHHSFAMFDKTRVVTVQGTVRKVEWTNPHVYIFVEVPDAKGGKMVRRGGLMPRPSWRDIRRVERSRSTTTLSTRAAPRSSRPAEGRCSCS